MDEEESAVRSCVLVFCHKLGVFGAVFMVEQLCELLLSCGYSMQEVTLLLQVTLNYHKRLCSRMNNFSRFSEEELVRVVLVEAFVCHCVFFDASCPLKYWFHALFLDYVNNLAELNAAVFRLVLIESPSLSL